MGRQGRVDLVHVLADGRSRPEIRALDSFRVEKSEADAFQRLRTASRLKNFRCMTLLAPGEYQLLQTDAPSVPDAELREAVRWRVKDQLDYPVNAATLDLVEIPTEGQAGRPKQVFAVAANNAVLGAKMQMFEETGIPLEVIDIPEMAQRNVAALFEEESRGLALLAFDETGGLLTFTFRGLLYATRRIEISSKQLSDADGDRRSSYLERICLELQRSLDHFDRQYSFVPLSRLLVTAVQGVPDLASTLAANLYVPVAELDLARALDFPAVPELKNLERQGEFIHLIGAALRLEKAS